MGEPRAYEREPYRRELQTVKCSSAFFATSRSESPGETASTARSGAHTPALGLGQDARSKPLRSFFAA